MPKLSGVVVLALSFVLSTPVFAWGPDGHRVVGSIADQLLNANAKQ
jgi:hypothetical protein